MARFRKRIVELEEAGESDEAIAETVLAEMNDHFSHDVTEFSLDLGSGDGPSVDGDGTVDHLVEENEWLRTELERAEQDYMELYEQIAREN